MLFGLLNTYFHIKSDLEALWSYAEVCCVPGLEMNRSLIEKKHLFPWEKNGLILSKPVVLTQTEHFDDEQTASEYLWHNTDDGQSDFFQLSRDSHQWY